MYRLHRFIVLLLSVAFLSCSSDDEEILSSVHVLKTFEILKTDNTEQLSDDAHVTIADGHIHITLDKYDDLRSLVASFEFEGKRVVCNGVEQLAGISKNDFTQSLVYSVEAEDGSKKDYRVNVLLNETQALTSFRFLKEDNKQLEMDVEASILGNEVYSFFHIRPETLIPVFDTHAKRILVDGKEQISGVDAHDFSKPVAYDFLMRNNEVVRYVVHADYMLSAVPIFRIKTEDASITEIPSKDYYLNAELEIDGQNVFENFQGTTEIKGRGNSTWGYPKKPYRLKLSKKASLCGFGTAKNYVLLANYLDPTLMMNAVAFKIAHLLEMPYTHHAIPVDVELNGKYKGSYMLTEQVEVKENRIDLDEDNCVVWELDSYFDEEPKFTSDAFGLPVMLKDPDMTDSQFNSWKDDFNRFARKFAENPLANNSYVDLIDIQSVVNYLIVYNLTHNMEINHPKSIYLYKEGKGKYMMGPVWDFDWAFDYEGTGRHFGKYNRPLWNQYMSNGVGYRFFHRFMEDPRVVKLYKETWTDFVNTKLDILLQYMEQYAKVLRPSIQKDSKIWNNTVSFETRFKEMKQWLKNRADYLTSEVNGMN